MALPKWNESTLNARSRTFTRSGNSPVIGGNRSAVRCSGIGESYWLKVAIHWPKVAILTRVSLFTKRHQKIIKVGAII